MNVGMMWLDTDQKRSFDEKVRRAAEYYEDKYGHLPELCFVNNNALSTEKNVDTVKVQPIKTVLPGHFWLGMST